MYAVHAIAAQSDSWHQASATRGRARLRASADPTLLPMPMPVRNTARISENVYVVAPKRSDRLRVQSTSAASAVIPDSADRDVDAPAIAGMRPRRGAETDSGGS